MSKKTIEVQREKLSTKILSLASNARLEHNNQPNKTNASMKGHKKYRKKQKPLTNEQVEVFRQAFEIFDSDHSGNIDQEELGSLLNALGFDYSAL